MPCELLVHGRARPDGNILLTGEVHPLRAAAVATTDSTGEARTTAVPTGVCADGADAGLAECLHRGTQCLGRAYSAISGGRSGAAAVGLHAVLHCAGSPICLCGIFRRNIAYALEHVVGEHRIAFFSL